MTTISLNAELGGIGQKSGPTDLVEYSGGSIGILRISGLFQKLFKTLGLFGFASSEMGRVQADLRATNSVLGVLDLPRSFIAASESVLSLSDQKVSLSRRVANAVADSFGALTSLGYAAVYLCGFGWLLAPIRIVDTAADAVELQINASNLHHVAQLEGQVANPAKEAVAHSKKFYACKTAIKATNVALSIIGFAILASGIPLVGRVVLSLLSLGAAYASIKVDLFKDPRKLLKCDRTIVV